MNEEVVAAIPADQYELYATFGMAAEKAQVLEVAAGNVALAFLTIFVDPDKITPEETEMYRSIVDDINQKTFGSLLTQLKKTLNLNDSITKTIDEALERRNYLTHRFFRTHNFALYSEGGRKLMMTELEEIQDKLDRAHKTLECISSILIQIAGRDALNVDTALQMQAQGMKVSI